MHKSMRFEDSPRGRIDDAERFDATVALAVEHIVSLAWEFCPRHRPFAEAVVERLGDVVARKHFPHPPKDETEAQ